MKAQFIFTYESKPQEITNYIPITINEIKDKEALLELITNALLDDVSDLVKISVGVTLDRNENIDCPDWFLQCNGKLYFENGVLI